MTLKEIRTDIKNWWIFLIKGILFIGVGIIVFANTLENYANLAGFFALSMMISGLFQKWFAILNSKEIEGWGWQLAVGIMEFVIGLILIFNLNFTVTILPFYVGFWLLFKSLALMGFSFELKSYKISSWFFYFALAVLLAVLSWFIILNPLLGGVTIVFWTGAALIVVGVTYILLAFKLKKVKTRIVRIKDSL